MNIVDVLIGGLILLGALQGYRKGLLTGLAQFVGSIIGFLVASVEYIKVLNWFETIYPIQRWLEPVIYRLLGPSLQAQTESMSQQSIDKILGMLPPALRNTLAGSNISGLLSTTTTTKGFLEQITHNLSGLLTEKILNLLSFALIYFGVAILIQVLVAVFLAPLGIFGGALNRGGGLLFGGLSAFFTLVVIGGVLSPILKIDTQNTAFLLVQHSFFLPYMLQTFQILSQAFSLQISKELQVPLNLLKGFSF